MILPVLFTAYAMAIFSFWCKKETWLEFFLGCGTRYFLNIVPCFLSLLAYGSEVSQD